MKTLVKNIPLILFLILVTVLIAQPPVAPSPAVDQTQGLLHLKSQGIDTPLTLLPVVLAGRPFDRVTEVVALGLEKQGLKNIVLGAKPFVPDADLPLDKLSEAVGRFVRQNPPATDFVVFADFKGAPRSGLNELRAVVADKSGTILWTDRQTDADTAFQQAKAREPMTMALLLVERLAPQLGLNAETAKAAKPGKYAQLMEERSGLPPPAERDAIPARRVALAAAAPTATLLVVPVAVPDQGEKEIAARVAQAIGAANLFKTVSAPAETAVLPAIAPDPNEMKMLWNLARSLRDYVKRNPPAADYVVCADYRFNAKNWERGYLHLVVCDRQGEWALVDMQNSHQKVYQSIKPVSKEGCEALLLKRLSYYLLRANKPPEGT